MRALVLQMWFVYLAANPACSKHILDIRNESSFLSVPKPHITICLDSKSNQWLNSCNNEVGKKWCVRDNSLFNGWCPSVGNEGLLLLPSQIWNALVISVIWTSSKTSSELFLIICLRCPALGIAPECRRKSVAPDVPGVHSPNQYFDLVVH